MIFANVHVYLICIQWLDTRRFNRIHTSQDRYERLSEAATLILSQQAIDRKGEYNKNDRIQHRQLRGQRLAPNHRIKMSIFAAQVL